MESIQWVFVVLLEDSVPTQIQALVLAALSAFRKLAISESGYIREESTLREKS